jgi:hypothetical protein
LRTAAIVALIGLNGCGGPGPYRPVAYQNGGMPAMEYGVPVTEGPILGNGGAFPASPGTIVSPGPVVTPGTPFVPPPGSIYNPPQNPPIMPPATNNPSSPPLNTPPSIGPMPRTTPPPASPTKG